MILICEIVTLQTKILGIGGVFSVLSRVYVALFVKATCNLFSFIATL